MNFGILSCSPKCYSTRRLVEAAKQRGHRVKVVNTMKLAIDLQKGQPDLYYRQEQLSELDAVLPRIGASLTYFGTAVVRQFEQMDVFTATFFGGDFQLARQASQFADFQSSSYWNSADRFCASKTGRLSSDRSSGRSAGHHQADRRNTRHWSVARRDRSVCGGDH